MRQKFFSSFFFCLFLFPFSFMGCSSKAGGGTPSTEIPAPVSHLSISSPDSDGLSRVTAEAGFADGGSTVAITNSNATSRNESSPPLLALLWIRSASAHATHTVTADADGSFAESIEAEAGDEISVEYTKDGSQTTVDSEVPENAPQLPSTANGEDVVYNPETNDAIVVGNDGANGILTFFNLETETATTATLDGLSGANRLDLDIANQILVIANADDPDNVYHYHIPTGNTVADSTGGNQVVDVAAGPDGEYAIIAFQGASPAFAFYDFVGDIVSADGEAADSDGNNQSEAHTLDIDNNGTSDILALLSEGADGNFFLSTHEIDTATPSFTPLTVTSLDDVDSPGGLVFFNEAAEVLITDSTNDRILRVAPATSTITTIETGDDPRGIAINSDENEAYVANAGSRILSVVDLSDSGASDVAPLGLSPARVAVDPTGERDTVIILNSGDNTLTIYNP